MDATANHCEEECVLDMEQSSNVAILMDVQAFLREEECVLDMGQRSSDAVVKGAKTKS